MEPPLRHKTDPSATRLNALVFGVGCFFLILVASLVQMFGLFTSTAGDDYRGYRATAEVIHTQPFARVYDGDALREAQRSMVYDYSHPDLRAGYVTQGAPYLPVFLALLEPLALFAPVPGFVVWTAINLAALAGYLWWFARRSGSLVEVSIIPALIFSFPAVDTLRWGQVSVWLMIFFGEFFRHSVQGAGFRAGLWLGGLLLKPQILILMLPGLLITRQWRCLAGFAASSLVLLLASLAIGGVDSFMALSRIIFSLSGDPSAARPQYMMNWRALGIGLSDYVSPDLVWPLIVAATIATAAAGLWLWRTPSIRTRKSLAIVLLGVYAATSCVSWHAHDHMALPIVVPLLYLSLDRILPYKVLVVWLLAPYATVLLRFALGNIGDAGLLIAHLYIIWWSFAALNRMASGETTGTTAAVL